MRLFYITHIWIDNYSIKKTQIILIITTMYNVSKRISIRYTTLRTIYVPKIISLVIHKSYCADFIFLSEHRLMYLCPQYFRTGQTCRSKGKSPELLSRDLFPSEKIYSYMASFYIFIPRLITAVGCILLNMLYNNIKYKIWIQLIIML